MKARFSFIISILMITILTAGCGKQAGIAQSARVKMLVGTARVEHGGANAPLAVGDTFGVGDIVRTGPASVLVATIGDDDSDMEIQENAVFSISDLSGRSGDLELKQGNLWLRLNRKLVKGEHFSLHSPTAVASIRGTKFYTFKIGDYYGTCMCQGSGQYESISGEKFSERQEQDYLIASNGKKTVIVTHEDLKPLAIKGDFHRHSALGNSPLGAKVAMTPGQFSMLKSTIDKKFKNAVSR